MIRLPRSLALLGCLTLAACSQQNTGPARSVDAVATVDGIAISRNTYSHYVQGMAGKPPEELSAEERDQLLDNLIRGHAVAAAAERSGLAARDETRAVLELQRLNILQQAAAEEQLAGRQPSEEELRAEYDLQVAQLDKLQYRASHIVVPTEDAAKALITQLQRGGNFAQLARQHSLDTNSAQNGGDLDWSSPGAMTPAFASVLTQLGKGDLAPEPIRSDHGWHVVRVTDVRDAVPPSFEAVRDRLDQLVAAKKFQAYVDGLMATAKVTKSP